MHRLAMMSLTAAILIAVGMTLSACSKGAKGERGERGPQGDPGEAGPPGTPGSSAIHIRTGHGPDETFCPLGENLIAAFCVDRNGTASTAAFLASRGEAPTGASCPDATQTTVYCAVVTLASP
jgi:hypothetical protein